MHYLEPVHINLHHSIKIKKQLSYIYQIIVNQTLIFNSLWYDISLLKEVLPYIVLLWHLFMEFILIKWLKLEWSNGVFVLDDLWCPYPDFKWGLRKCMV